MAHFPTKTLSLPTGFRILKAKEAVANFPYGCTGVGAKWNQRSEEHVIGKSSIPKNQKLTSNAHQS